MDYNKIRGAAAAYYANSSDEEQLQAWKFYKSLHTDGNGTVSRKEYLSFLEKEGYTDAQIEFRMLDKNGDGSLDFEECTTLFYIIRVHRGAVACKNGCGAYLWPWDIYFVCAECYEAGGDTYDLCCDCYRKKDFKHQHAVFLDKFTLLRDKFKLLRDRQPTAEIPTATSTRQVQSQTNRETEGIFEAAKAHYAALPESGKQEVRNRFKTMDSDGDGAVSSRSYSDYLTKAGYSDDHLFDLFDKNGDGKLDFDEYITSDFIHTMHGHNRCSGCSVTLLGIYFVCVKCYDAGKTSNLCCKCYGDKSYKHLDDHTHFSDTHSLIDIKRPKPTSATRDQVQSQTNRETEGIFEAAKAHYAALSESGKQEVRNRFKTMDSDGYGAVSSRCYSDYLTKAGYPDDHLFDLFDKNGDGKMDFEEYIASDFIYTMRGRNRCGGCSVALLGIYFVCVKCYDAGKTYNLCCKCYGEKSYNHLDGHTHFSDTHSLIDIKRSKPASATRASMEALVKTARLYYDKSSSKVKDSAHEFYKSLDRDNDRKVSPKEFLLFMRQKGHKKMSNRRFFEELDKDGSGTLEFMEVMALYYIIKSGRPFCDGCDDFIPGMYFTCSKCFENGNPLFCVCPKCFENELYVHEHAQFLDNFALLEAKRMQVIATYSEQHKPTSSVTTTNAVVPHKPQSPKPASSSVTITELPTSTTNVVVYKPQPPKLPSSPVTIVQLLISPTNAVAPPKFETRVVDSAFRILEGAIASAVGTLCTIM